MQAETPNFTGGSRAQKWDKPVTYVRNKCTPAMRGDKINFATVGKKCTYVE